MSSLFQLSFFLKYKIDFNLTYFTGYIGYLVLGYYLSIKTYTYHRVKKKTIAVLLIGAGIGCTILGTYYNSILSGRFDKTFYDYLTPNVLLFSLGIFIFLKNINFKNSILRNVILSISKYSYGIYFVHILVLIM